MLNRVSRLVFTHYPNRQATVFLYLTSLSELPKKCPWLHERKLSFLAQGKGRKLGRGGGLTPVKPSIAEGLVGEPKTLMGRGPLLVRTMLVIKNGF